MACPHHVPEGVWCANCAFEKSPLPTIGQDPRIGALGQLDNELLQALRTVKQLAVEAVQALRSLEWIGPLQAGVRTCPACYCGPDEGHDSGCKIGTVLHRATELGVG